MRRFLIVFTAVFLTACSLYSSPAPTLTVLPPTATIAPTVKLTWTPSPLPPSPTPSPTATFTPEPTSTPIPFVRTSPDFSVQIHPEDGLYVGDQVSFEVIPPPGKNMDNHSVQVNLDGPQGKLLGSVGFQPFGIGSRSQATLQWVWDTRSQASGDHTLYFSILPGGPTWSYTVNLQPLSALPVQYQGAHWETATSSCCELHYITGTAAERDIQDLMSQADAQAQDVIQKFGIGFTEPISVTLVPRVLGQGGFASNEISISYLDRNYGGNNFDLVLHHEMIHILDGRLGGDLRPTMLVEGLAVYFTGGHFKKVDVLSQTAGMLQIQDAPYAQGDLGWIIPLRQLADHFYPSQHEIGYMEAAGLIKYMVQKYGWDGYNQFYRDIHQQESGSQADAIDAALQKHFGITLSQLQDQFISTLRSQKVASNQVEDMRETVRYFDTMRRYQDLLDPSAYFAHAWLLDSAQMRQKGIVADYTRHPDAPYNLALETLLVEADNSLLDDRYAEVNGVIDSVNAVLDAIQRQLPDPFGFDPQAQAYYNIVLTLLAAGYRPQQIQLNGEAALAKVTLPPGEASIQVMLQQAGNTWQILK